MYQSSLYILLYIKYYNFKNNIKSKTGITKRGHKRGYLNILLFICFIYYYLLNIKKNYYNTLVFIVLCLTFIINSMSTLITTSTCIFVYN